MRFSSTFISLLSVALLAVPAPAQSTTTSPLYNTAKQKLAGRQAGFQLHPDRRSIPPAYCEAAKHYDYTWFEMQHSTLEFKDIEAMIAACPHVAATPMIRLPDAQEWHIQHATDIGALGVIVPTVDDVDRAREAAKWSRYPPVARRSSGQGQARSIWGINGIDYRQNHQRQHAGGGDDRNAHRRRQRVRHRLRARRRRGDHRQQRSERVFGISADRRPRIRRW